MMTKAGCTSAAPEPGLRILLAEDKAMNELVARAILEKRGHTVVVAHDGREALAFARTQRFDVILMDVQMPVMDGLAATAAIRQIETGSGRHVPIVGVTAHAMKGDREKCVAAGMDGYVSKPIRPAELFAAIDDAIQARAADVVGTSSREDAPPASPVLDEAGLLSLVSGNPELLREVADLFLEDSPERLAEIRAALGAGDLDALQLAAHTLKGSAGSLCGRRTAEIALRIEMLAEKRDLGRARLTYALLEEEVGKLQQALARVAEGSWASGPAEKPTEG